MAKKALFDVLERTIGKYVVNLDAESLNVAVWSGKIELHSLELNIQAVNEEISRRAIEAPNLALPLRVTSGHFTSFQVDVPWANLTSKPVVLRAQGLSVSLEPFNHLATTDILDQHEDETTKMTQIQSQRDKSLQVAEIYRQQAVALQKLAEQDLEGDGNKKSTFGARLVRRLLENVQIEVKDVHLSINGAGCSAGVILDFFQLVTTDMLGHRTFVDRTAGRNKNTSFLHKALEIRGLGIYMDEDVVSGCAMPSIIEEEGASRHSYILAPLSFETKLRQADATVCRDYPKYYLESEVHGLSIVLSKLQLELLRKTKNLLQQPVGQLSPMFPEYRPLLRPLQGVSARDWWRYAYRSIGRLNGKRAWMHFYQVFKLRKRYIDLYKRKMFTVTCPWLTPLTPQEVDEMQQIEHDRTISVDGIMTWRTIATGQLDKERTRYQSVTGASTTSRGSVFKSLFGPPSAPVSLGTEKLDTPPITLSTDELQQLETISMERVADNELSLDSRLCDIKFVLGSLDLQLTTYDKRPLTGLIMGTVTASFCANVDGSYVMECSMTRLVIIDRVTPQSIFPNILQNQRTSGGIDDEKNYAFRAHVSRLKAGDQVVKLWLGKFEAVASPKLIVEVKHFLAEDGAAARLSGIAQNPVLAQSMSGSVDIFYDASEGEDMPSPPSAFDKQTGSVASAIFDPSQTLIAAWKSKTDRKAAWMVDLDIQAPIVVVPESCTDLQAGILLFNLGRFQISYGKGGKEIAGTRKVYQWFLDNPRIPLVADVVLEHGALCVDNLTFAIGQAHQLQSLLAADGPNADSISASAIYEPMSLETAFAVESSGCDLTPRFCLYGVIPAIGVNISPVLLHAVISVLKAWKNIGSFGEGTALIEPPPVLDRLMDDLRYTVPKNYEDTTEIRDVFTSFYVDVNLQRLSVSLKADNGGDGIEAHLISVSASLASKSDTSSLSRLTMGWFWIVDRLDYDFQRCQRLLVHSQLPLDADGLAGRHHQILNDLEEMGVFDDDFVGSTELADISVRSGGAGRTPEPFRAMNNSHLCKATVTAMDGHFATLNINWNPLAVKQVVMAMESILFVAGEIEGAVILSRPSELQHKERIKTPVSSCEKDNCFLLVKVLIERFAVTLRSAKDDLPIYMVTMSTTDCSYTYCEGSTNVSFKVDNFTVSTPELGRTLPKYRTILGLMPGEMGSLLSLQYFDGPRAMQSAPLAYQTICEAYASITLSPVRLVYIHAQVMSLAEYMTEGILGVVSARVAMSAAQAATEISASKRANKRFLVNATGLNVWVPRSAHSGEHITVKTGNALVDYVSSPTPSGGHTTVALKGVRMADSTRHQMLESDVNINIEADIPPVGVGSVEDQAMRVTLSMSAADFVLSKNQYQQIMQTLVSNIGEVDLFLRDADDEDLNAEVKANKSAVKPMTHAGTPIIDIPRRIYFNLEISALTVLFIRVDEDDPLVRMSAVQAIITLAILGDLELVKAEATLKDLACTDERLEAIGRQQRSLIYQRSSADTHDIFFVSYESTANLCKNLKLALGSPRLVFVPDAVSEVLLFFTNEQSRSSAETLLTSSDTRYIDETEDSVVIDAINETDEFETSLTPTVLQISTVSNFEVKTERCSLLLVDLGSTDLLPNSRMSISVTSLAETIVFEGAFDINFSSKSANQSKRNESVNCQFHANGVEAYVAYGSELLNPIQILEPAEVSLYIDSGANNDGKSAMSVRVATAASLDVTISMRNVALFHAILASIDECFQEGMRIGDSQQKNEGIVNADQTAQIESLAKAFSSEPDSSVVLDPQSRSDLQVANIVPRSNKATSRRAMSMSVKLTISEASLTCINDLQGIDEAIMRVTVRNLTGAAQVKEEQLIPGTKLPYTAFQFTLQTSILADYFDSGANQWSVLLSTPCEVACRASRGISHRFTTKRPSTTVDLESFPLHLTCSEHFLLALASANYMWKVYSQAIEYAVMSQATDASDLKLRRSVATSAARTLIKSLPYAIENHTGVDIQFMVDGVNGRRRSVAHGMVEYFTFAPPRSGLGRGGRRLYGQDVVLKKSIMLLTGGASFQLDDVDKQVALPKFACELGGHLIICSVGREGNTVVVHLSSGVEISNRTYLPFSVGVRIEGEDIDIGVCRANEGYTGNTAGLQEASVYEDGRVAKASSYFGVPSDCLKGHRVEWEKNGVSHLTLVLRPLAELTQVLRGIVTLSCDSQLLASALKPMTKRYTVMCTNQTQVIPSERYDEPLEFQVVVLYELINGYPCLAIVFEPKAKLINRLPISVLVRTPMPRTYTKSYNVIQGERESIHDVGPDEWIEIFTPGPSIAVSFKCKDLPVAGTLTDWMEGWVDLPLVLEFRLLEPLRCLFPLSRHVADPLAMNATLGGQFLIIDEAGATLKAEQRVQGERQGQLNPSHSYAYDELAFTVTGYNYAVDHTGEILFEQVSSSSATQFRRSFSYAASSERQSRSGRQLNAPLGAFNLAQRYRISLLPDSHVSIRILQLTMEGDDGIRKGSPFFVDDVAICEGGALSSPLSWEDGRKSGYFAYRKLLSSYQSEVHIIPEYVVFNGGEQPVIIKQPGCMEMLVASGKIIALKTNYDKTATISVKYRFGARTSPLRVDALGLRVAIIKSPRGEPIGSLPLQTVVGSVDSRLVIKLGEAKLGPAAATEKSLTGLISSLSRDFFRLRFQCSELSVTLQKSNHLLDQKNAIMEPTIDRLQTGRLLLTPKKTKLPKAVAGLNARSGGDVETSDREAVCTIRLHRCTVDWQRVFKNKRVRSTPMAAGDVLNSEERSQLSVIIHNIQLRDDTPNSAFPVVFDSTSNVSFVDLCVRFRGPISSELVKVDLVDLKLAHTNGLSQPIVINTSEEFVWKLLDLANRIMRAAAEFSGVVIELKWDPEHGGYSVAVSDTKNMPADDGVRYAPPKIDKLFDINQVRVSPFAMQLSFQRVPISSRYKLMTGFRGANIMNYFTTRLKFKIDQAELKFSRFESLNVRGPLDHLVEMLSTVYMSRMKLKFVSIMTAASFQDWKKLASREGGDDEFVEGDLLRVAGNIAGNSANYVLKKAGMGLGQGISTVTHALGDGIESATSAVGARTVGAGVNSLVSGVGDGVGDALTGVGTGAGKVVKGVGKGVGQVFGGLSGGAVIVGKGFGKGLIEGDGRAISTSLSDGATSVGTGVGQGIETLVQGTASGVYSLGNGIFSGVKTIGQGIGGAFTGKHQRKPSIHGGEKR
ncbi:hypothetical protein MPSEU_000204700 [Mayamaea pseudoterrestris]|nr:hypothetical protein MPSEU_000204700 [Mayamaea pseudoterrestris]